MELEYRKKTYLVFPSRTSAGWDWAVELNQRTVQRGEAATEQAAIEAAKQLIVDALAPGKRRWKRKLAGSSRDGGG